MLHNLQDTNSQIQINFGNYSIIVQIVIYSPSLKRTNQAFDHLLQVLILLL